MQFCTKGEERRREVGAAVEGLLREEKEVRRKVKLGSFFKERGKERLLLNLGERREGEKEAAEEHLQGEKFSEGGGRVKKRESKLFSLKR